VVIVSSGAIGVGLGRLDIEKRPKQMPKIQVRLFKPVGRVVQGLMVMGIQALAAVGQCRLMSLWDSLFAHRKQPVAQILLTRNDIADVRWESV